MTMREHGTLARYQTGCRCDDCTYAQRFVRLQMEFEEPTVADDRRFHTPRRSKTRPFPARDLVMAVGQPNTSIFADMIGASRGTVAKWLRTGVCLTIYEADRYAIRAGTHPAVVWGREWYADDLV